MTKAILLAGAGLLIAAPAAAQQVTPNVTYTNNIATSVVNSSTNNSDVLVTGTVTVNGNIEVDSSANAIVDGKQIIDGNTVVFGNVDDDDDGDDANDGLGINTINPFTIGTTGNVGVNVAAGQYNVQSNDTAISSSSSDGLSGDDGAAASANTTNWQSLSNTYYGNNTGTDSYQEGNTASTGDVVGNGNIGMNAAAGAFNLQANKMAISTAFDTSLANASSGSVQQVAGNVIALQETINIADIGNVGGSGSLGVNVAAGVGNVQSNSLSVASAR